MVDAEEEDPFAVPVDKVDDALCLGNGRVGRHRGEKLRPGFPDQGPGRKKACRRGRNVLVRNIDLLFQRIQLRIVENLPPFTAKRIVSGLRLFPAFGIFEIGQREFLVCRRGLCGRCMVRRADHAPCKEARCQRRNIL